MQKRFVAVAFIVAFGVVGCTPVALSGWREISISGLICSDGSPWKFYVNQGDSKKVLVDFQGGGACWNEASCDPKRGLHTQSLNKIELEAAQGIYNKGNNANPFKGWTHIFVPYCTADLHWGNSVQKYSYGTIQHKGTVNAQAALEYTFQNFPLAQNIVVTGCSAGSYGAAMWASRIMKHYNKARVALFGDSGLGIITTNFANLAFNVWKAQDSLPDFIPELASLKTDLGQLRVDAIYKAAAKTFPDNSFSQFSSNSDAVQNLFYALALGLTQPTQATTNQWIQEATASLEGIKAVAPNYANYVIAGNSHCIVNSPNFYTTRVNNVSLMQWVNELVSKTPADVIVKP